MEPPNSGSNFRSTVFESIEDPVTLETMTKAVTLIPCGHTLNEDTAIQVIALDRLCPLDRRPIQSYTPNYTVRQLAEAARSQPLEEGPTKEAKELFLKGKELADQKKYEEAVEIFLNVLCLSSNYEKAQAYLDFCLKQTSSKLPPPRTSPNISAPTTLHQAAKHGDLDAIKLLMDKGALINAKNKRGSTPLHEAASNGHVGAIKLLIKNGAQVNAKNRWGLTPLHEAASNGHVGAIILLIDKGAQVNAKNRWGLTPLHEAASNGHVGAIKLLINYRAKVDAKGKRGSTPLYLAKVIKTFINRRAKVDYKDNWGSTPLHLAAENGHEDAIKTLIRYGAKVDAENNDGKTPLQKAEQNNKKRAIRVLKRGQR